MNQTYNYLLLSVLTLSIAGCISAQEHQEQPGGLYRFIPNIGGWWLPSADQYFEADVQNENNEANNADVQAAQQEPVYESMRFSELLGFGSGDQSSEVAPANVEQNDQESLQQSVAQESYENVAALNQLNGLGRLFGWLRRSPVAQQSAQPAIAPAQLPMQQLNPNYPHSSPAAVNRLQERVRLRAAQPPSIGEDAMHFASNAPIEMGWRVEERVQTPVEPAQYSPASDRIHAMINNAKLFSINAFRLASSPLGICALVALGWFGYKWYFTTSLEHCKQALIMFEINILGCTRDIHARKVVSRMQILALFEKYKNQFKSLDDTTVQELKRLVDRFADAVQNLENKDHDQMGVVLTSAFNSLTDYVEQRCLQEIEEKINAQRGFGFFNKIKTSMMKCVQKVCAVQDVQDQE